VVDDLFDVLPAAEGAEPDAVVLRLHVQPGAGRTAVTGRYGDALKVKVAAPPEGGRANQAVIDLVASVLGTKAARVEVTSGQSSRTKRVKVTGVVVDDVRRVLTEQVAAGNKAGGPGVRPTAR
jgi:uncharacterized protein (TIGR00251 family)